VSLQVKLLQVIEEKTFTRVGGNQPITVDVRIIAATNRDLDEMVASRQFREDLFFRLNVFPIRLPSLRERPGDIAPLVGHFMVGRGAAREQVTPAALRALEQYAFPGNVRELEHTLERAMILAGTDPIGTEHLSFARPELMGGAGVGTAAGAPNWVPMIPSGGLSLETLERELILQALDLARGNKSQAARLLDLTRRTLYSRMEKHGLREPGEGPGDGDERGDDEAGDAADVRDAGDVRSVGGPGREGSGR
jgi:transcriptional regulator with GAF, ATPase, and Fis domain